MAVIFLLFGPAPLPAPAEEVLPAGAARPALQFPHFPDRLHAFVWRNWNLVETERLAKVLETSAGNVRAVAASMGLPAEEPVSPEWDRRGYITILRRNWHLLPYDQLLTLLDLPAGRLAHLLREDDFLFLKLGNLKPACEPLKYAPPGEKAAARAAEIGRLVREAFGEELAKPAEPRFAFVKALGGGAGAPAPPAAPAPGLRFIYSYFATFGDPLSDPTLDPFPDALLRRLAQTGVNGVWLHVVLRDLAPGDAHGFPEFGQGHARRLANLAALVQRAKRFGVGVYLYMNEPRAMPPGFFKGRPEMAGVREGDHVAMCTSDPKVRRWLSDSLTHVFKSVPDLGGVFTITASENLTNCASHYGQANCPRCKGRTGPEIVAEVNAAIEAGVRAGSAGAKVLAWDWGWKDEWAEPVINALPKSVWLMSVSEWSLPIERGGVKGAVGEYSISAVGPGPRATRHWALAKKAGLKTAAKVQLNNTWELSAVPYLPVLDLVAEHCDNLAGAGVDGMMLSWSLGGYPSPNLRVAQRLASSPKPDRAKVLDELSVEYFGPEGGPHARRAWTLFSDAFRQYPYHIGSVYTAPQQYGPSNLLYAEPTGYKATMVGFPYDDVNSWRADYPADVFAAQFEKVAAGWEQGLAELAEAARKAPPARAAEAAADLGLARAAGLHFRAVANQVRFTLARDALLAAPAGPEREKRIAEVRKLADDEAAVARQLFSLARRDARIGFEASNHYYYVPQDLVEKFINCRDVAERLAPKAGAGAGR